ncbi:MAG: Asp-tRNA(Asn)/Glu-tRNA(Gln) amidotransferase subunit GatC [Planctomycetaceae bacterium]|nr:Asp-tRNA(Asn)/Glu-tRNA(Gln) amidotransferase subunit GatC [Planctomycetaceae bacterium]
MSELTVDDVKKVASLARLKLSGDDIARYQKKLENVLSYVHLLDEVDTSDVEPMAHAIEAVNVFRQDEPRDSLDQAQALANAPQTDGKYFLVPAILDEA